MVHVNLETKITFLLISEIEVQVPKYIAGIKKQNEWKWEEYKFEFKTKGYESKLRGKNKTWKKKNGNDNKEKENKKKWLKKLNVEDKEEQQN